MQSETKSCQSCKGDFIIAPEDFDFYRKMDVPPPTFCPECRLVRRLVTRNERTLYRRVCDLCKTEVLSTYSADKKMRTYCPECYKSDKWDPLSYGRDYDFNRPFFQQLDELYRDVPRVTLRTRNSINCDYSEDIVDSKNCYLVFGAFMSTDCMYGYTPVLCRDCVDVTVTYKSERAYEVTDCTGVYNSMFARLCNETLDSAFIFDCDACSDCFGSVNLRHKKYYLFNKALSRAEYKKERAKWDLGSYQRLLEAKQKFEELYYATPRRYALLTNAANCTGDYIVNAKNCHSCFSVIDGAENLKYVQLSGLALKDSYDVWGAGAKSQMMYENVGGLELDNVAFTSRMHNSLDVRYATACKNSSHIFGSAGLNSKEYCIFNKQYSKKDYEALVARIIEQARLIPYIDKKGREYRYGEAMPIELSPHAYNESLAFEKFPLSKEGVANLGYPWKDEELRLHQVTVKSGELPDHIRDVPDSITEESIGCAHNNECGQKCTLAFKITPRELQFYRLMSVALPRLCPNCRHAEREKARNPWQLWRRDCQCAGRTSANGAYTNSVAHAHGNVQCRVDFLTPYNSQRREIVYCESCYQSEIL